MASFLNVIFKQMFQERKTLRVTGDNLLLFEGRLIKTFLKSDEKCHPQKLINCFFS